MPPTRTYTKGKKTTTIAKPYDRKPKSNSKTNDKIEISEKNKTQEDIEDIEESEESEESEDIEDVKENEDNEDKVEKTTNIIVIEKSKLTEEIDFKPR
jgi:hypothetical protein